MKTLLDQLPQKAVIDQADASRWVEGVLRWEGERASWHVQRLYGFGGSDIGAVIRGVLDLKESGFQTLPKIIEQKLMKRLPLRQDVNMQRGTVLEDLARLAFMYRYGAVRDSAALLAMEGPSQKAGYEWLVGNADDVCLLNGKRLLVDYKVPSTYSDTIDFDYSAQLHHYALKGRMRGVKFDGFLLAKLDLAPELAHSLVAKFPSMPVEEQHQLAKTIAMADVPGMRIVALGVEHKKSMDIDILDVGSYAWNDFVLKGVVPPTQTLETIQLQDAQLLDLANLQQEYALAKAGMSHLSEIASVAEAKMYHLLKDVDLNKAALPVNIVKVSPKNYDKSLLVEEALAKGASESELAPEAPPYVITALVDEIKRLNGDPEAPHLFDQSPDPAKAKSYLEALEDYDMAPLRQPGISVSLSRKTADKQMQEGMILSAKEAITPWFEQNLIGNDFDADLEHEDQLQEWGGEAASGTLLGTDTADAAEHDEVESQIPRKSASLR